MTAPVYVEVRKYGAYQSITNLNMLVDSIILLATKHNNFCYVRYFPYALILI